MIFVFGIHLQIYSLPEVPSTLVIFLVSILHFAQLCICTSQVAFYIVLQERVT